MIPEVNVPSIVDSAGIIRRAYKVLPDELKLRFFAVLAELENEDCYLKKRFSQANLKRVLGTELPVYTANIDTQGEWKMYLCYDREGKLYLKDLICSQTSLSKDSLSKIADVNEF